MSPTRVCLLFIIIIKIQMRIVFGNYAKGSLAFAIDDTGSMTDDIEQVRNGASRIFQTVSEAKDSQIQDYVVVTFNDPDALLRKKTADKTDLQNAINSITVGGGGDCPEYAMTGIELALKNSLPFSYIYVFTDATAKDYKEYERVKRIAQQKQSQIVFALTGDCSGGRDTPQYQVYNRIAEDTSGQVFHIDKNQVKDILNYVRETVTGKRNLIASLKFPRGREQKFNFTIDSKTGSTTIAVSGLSPEVDIIGPDGIKPTIENIVETSETKIVKLTDPKPGTYSVVVGSDSKISVVVTGKTDVFFQHGFSPLAPTSISDTVTRPGADGNTFLSIKLTGEGVTLQTVKILNMDNSIITELPLEMINEKEQFYGTKQFNPPDTAFRIEVVGYDVNNNAVIRRAQSSIQRLSAADVDEGEKVNTAPSMTIPGGSEVTVEYEAPLKLTCRVHAYPEPTVVWQEVETGTLLSAEIHKLEANVIVAILDIRKSDKNCTYQCKSRNAHGEIAKNVLVVTKTHFDVIEIPQNQTVEYNTTGHFTCKVHALPSATITWYNNSNIITGDANIVISDDATVLTIKQMQPNLKGNHKCEASNKFETKEFNFNIEITGVEIPKIYKPVANVHVRRGTHAELTCRLVQGKPKPAIRWEFHDISTNTFRKLKQYTAETIELEHVTANDTGSYKCFVENIMGSDQLIVDLIVEYPPTIEQDNTERKLVKVGDMVPLRCTVDGVPSPSVKWYKNDTILNDSPKFRISKDNSMRFEATLDDIGYYTCVAENSLGTADSTVFVEVYIPVRIETPDTTTIDRIVGTDIILTCKAHGYPEPAIQWLFPGSDSMKTPANVRFETGTSVKILRVQIDNEGAYTCNASNVGGAVNLTYMVNVIAAPAIINKYTSKEFKAVVGDPALRIQCNATGRPKPTISWIKDGSAIDFDTDRYFKAEDGTLIIKNVTGDAQGIYVCRAENNSGKKSITYVVKVNDYPPFRNNAATSTKLLEAGSTADIECPLRHESTDLIRWYKNDRIMKSGELKFSSVMREDAGYYTCRVSNDFESWSAHAIIKIGSKPFFITEETKEKNDLLTPLVCTASGDPNPTIVWRHNGIVLSQPYTQHVIETDIQTGKYECVVTNVFGSVSRAFEVKQLDCVLDTARDFFNSKQPVLQSEKPKWPIYDVNKHGNVVIEKNKQIHLYCPKGFHKIELKRNNIVATCVGGKLFNVKGKIMNYSEIECADETMPVKHSRGKCLGANKLWDIGFIVDGDFFPVYQVCMTKDKVTFYTVNTLNQGLTRVSRDISNMIDKTNLYPEKLIACGYPRSNNKHINSRWCFENRQLVNYRDLHPNIPVSASYYNSNLIPLWSPCSSNNWDEVEERIRILADASASNLLVYTGAFGQLVLPDNSTVCLKNNQPVRQYLWKVVEDLSIAASLAIIQVNVPGLLCAADAIPYMFCKDICHLTKWMNGTDWHNVRKGYVFCCNSQKFDDIIKKYYNKRIKFRYTKYLLYAANESKL